ncbi:MAG: penicillin-binding protein [Hyphomicrobiales bacterium]|nr:penicillin-binding protein [Hyphomicrobiales bacterium]
MGARRREPGMSRSRDSGGEALRVGPEDRITGGRKRGSRERIEPDMTSARVERDDEDRPMPRGRGKTDPDDQDEAPRRGSGRRKAPRRSILGGMVYAICVCGVWVLVAVGGIIAWHASQLPPIDKLTVPKRPPNIAITGDDGRLLANRGDTGGAAISLRELPAYVPKAFIAIEDRRFYHHWGIDPVGVTRALVRNTSGRGNMQGGSTLTQQLAKNLFLTQERTMSRKVQEAILAFWLERKFSKDQILELYLNRVYFGSGAYGVEAAARKYFGHGARETTLPEAAMLAGLMKAPTKLAPNRNPAAAADRASQVITAMAQEGMITDRMAALAIMQPATVSRETAGSINYAADFVMDVLDETVGAIDEDIVVSTTLSSEKQAAAEKALTDELDKSGKRFGVTQGALVSLDPNGQIKALVGGRNYTESQFNRAVSARRQPGSAFKPFVYLTALERGMTPETIRDDAPINVRGWQPENSSQDYQGQVTLKRALAMSLNTVAVRLGLEVTPKAVVATAHRLGVSSELQANASIALGTSEVSPLELVSAYAPFANGGIRVQPHIITRVRTARGKLLYQRKGASFGRVIDIAQVGMMNAMLQETLSIGTARHAELPGWQAAGKTGTSQDYRDAWFVGYTSQLVTGVWLGNDDNSPTKKTSGGNLPVNIWSKYMRAALQGAAPTPLPGVSRGVDPAIMLPPAEVGATGPQARRDAIGDMIAPTRERNFFERLFGG